MWMPLSLVSSVDLVSSAIPRAFRFGGVSFQVEKSQQKQTIGQEFTSTWRSKGAESSST
jgi:hypothetical protein